MDETKLRQLMHEAHRHGIHHWRQLRQRYLDQGWKCEACKAEDFGPMVEDFVWLRIVFTRKEWDKILCQKCMEFCLGRKITAADCKLVPWNVFRGNIKLDEGKRMANRSIQQKILKMKKAQKTVPKYLSAEAVKVSRYNGTSPYAMNKRKFEAPDATVMERDDEKGLVFGVMPDEKPKQFNSLTMAKVHVDLNRAKALEPVVCEDWQSWKRTGQTNYVRESFINNRFKRLDLWFWAEKFYWFEEDSIRNTHKRSILYTSRTQALLALEQDITWKVVMPLTSS